MSTFKVSTKADENSVAAVTTVTVIYDDAAAERALATSAAIVKAQGSWRKHGIPADVTIKLSDLAPGKRMNGSAPVTLASVSAAAKGFTPEDRAALRALLETMA